MSSSHPTSSELLVRLQALDQEAFHLLVLWASPLVSRWLQPLELSVADFDEVFQETFLSVHSKFDTYQQAPGVTFRQWLRTLVQHQAIELQRKRQQNLTDSQCAEIAKCLAHDDADYAENESDVRRSIWLACRVTEAQFSPSVWQAFWQTSVLSKSTAEVASSLGVSPVAVRKYKSRVLAALRAELAFWG
jgi:RNA polymerase sigma-70 factor (ECF subfamily)